MPRISFIPPPLDFNDRSTAIVAPILSNAMRLAETFTTEVPRIRMQQEAVAEDQRRYDAGQARQAQRDLLGDQRYDAERSHLKMREAVGDQRYDDNALRQQFGGYEALLRPDAVDTDGDGVGDLNGSVGPRGVAMPRVPSTRAPSAGSEAAIALRERGLDDSNARFEQEQRNRFISDYIKQNVGTSIAPKFRSIEEADAAWRQINPPRTDIPAIIEGGTAAVSPFGSDDGKFVDGGDGGGETSTSDQGGMLTMQSTTTPVYSAMQRMLALQKLDQMKAIPADRRARVGLPNDIQIEQLKMQIAERAQAEAQPAEVPPAEGQGDPTVFSAGRPTSRGPVDEQSEAVPQPTAQPYAGFERTPTADNLTKLARDSDSIVAALAREAAADPSRDVGSFTANQYDPTGASSQRPPLDLQAGADAARMLVNPSGLPDWLLPFIGQQPPTVPADVTPALKMMQGAVVDPATGGVRFRPVSTR